MDFSTYDALLQKDVDERGLVAYAAWKANRQDWEALDGVLADFGCVDLSKPAEKTAQIAYWINVYNAVALARILREYPTTSIRNHTAKVVGYNIWKDLMVQVDGREYSLHEIEHAILRKQGEPRIHLAIVCASRGCPQLWNHAYSGRNLDAELTANGKRFLASSLNFQADSASNLVCISRLMEWYGGDFAATPAGQLKALPPMLPEGMEWTGREGIGVSYLPYDGSLNDQRPVR